MFFIVHMNDLLYKLRRRRRIFPWKTFPRRLGQQLVLRRDLRARRSQRLALGGDPRRWMNHRPRLVPRGGVNVLSRLVNRFRLDVPTVLEAILATSPAAVGRRTDARHRETLPAGGVRRPHGADHALDHFQVERCHQQRDARIEAHEELQSKHHCCTGF